MRNPPSKYIGIRRCNVSPEETHCVWQSSYDSVELVHRDAVNDPIRVDAAAEGVMVIWFSSDANHPTDPGAWELKPGEELPE